MTAALIMLRQLNPFLLVTLFVLRWWNTRVFYRHTSDDAGNEFLYEFVLVPLDAESYMMHISQIDVARRKTQLVERTITKAEFEKLHPLMLEI